MATRVHQGQPYHHPQPAFEPESFTPQRQSRGTTANPRYRRTRSPDQQADAHFYSGSDEPPSPSKEGGFPDSPGRVPQRSRPTSMANANGIQGRGKHADLPSAQGLPPSYPGDDAMDDRAAPMRAPPADARRRAERQARRTSGSGGPPPPNPYGPGPQQAAAGSPRGPSHSSPRNSVPDGRRSPPVQQQPPQQQQHLAPPGPQSSEISRLSSPSINQSVLQPLEKKMKEYRALMAEAESDMTHLDEELRVLQERRRQAEDRFVEARSRHDEYERQHGDVERALRGDFAAPPPREQPQQVQIQPGPQQRPSGPSQQQSWTMARAPSMDSFDDRPGTGQSMSSRQPKKRGNRFGIKLW
ncbi:hypothetical protein ACHAQA_008021 [Verticillium albo-atrum]